MTSDPHHRPVLYEPLLELAEVRPGERWVDCTLGRGGHAEGLLKAGAALWAIDQDPDALSASAARLAPYAERLTLVPGNFRNALAEVKAQVGAQGLDGLIADLGVSSPQLDQGHRGFSFTHNGPVDMRMDPTTGPTALTLIRESEIQHLAGLLRRLGEEPFAGPIAKALKIWAEGPGPHDTHGMANVVSGAMPRKMVATARKHPATRTFQALRLAVNDELGALDDLLAAIPDLLAPGGRALIISFHSLEDRRVKRAFADLAGRTQSSPAGRRGLPPPVESVADFELITKKARKGDAAEIEANPRARSAVLRGLRRKGGEG